jgi:hypothetical protein
VIIRGKAHFVPRVVPLAFGWGLPLLPLFKTSATIRCIYCYVNDVKPFKSILSSYGLADLCGFGVELFVFSCSRKRLKILLQGEQKIIWSSRVSSACPGLKASSLSASSEGHPWRVGFGKSSARCLLASSRKRLSLARLCSGFFALVFVTDKDEGPPRPFCLVFLNVLRACSRLLTNRSSAA